MLTKKNNNNIHIILCRKKSIFFSNMHIKKRIVKNSFFFNFKFYFKHNLIF